MKPHYKYSIAVCARWETRFIVEFLRYYQMIGFDHVFLYCNDDDPTDLHTKVEPFTRGLRPFVTFRHHAQQGQQREMYLDFLAEFAKSSEWFGFIDVDEFLRLRPGTTIAQFLNDLAPDIGAILFNWVFFGPNGHKIPPDAPVLEAFTRRQAFIHQNTKFLMRSEALSDSPEGFDQGSHPFWHRPHALMGPHYKIINAIGEDASDDDALTSAGIANDLNEASRQTRLFNTAVIHHYAFRSEQAFAERAARGTLGSFAGQQMWKSLAEGVGFTAFLASVNEVEDGSLSGFWRKEAPTDAQLQVNATPDRHDKIIQFIATLGDRSIFAPFQSVGDDCEFALMQRHIGIEKLHLLQWASTSPELLLAMLRRNFDHFADDGKMTFLPAAFGDHREMIMHDHVYGLVGHTWIDASSHDLDKQLADYQKRLRYLRSKILDDLVDSNYIFVYRHMEPLNQSILQDIASELARFGNNILFVVSRADQEENTVGQVGWVADRVLQGFINERTTPIWLFEDKVEGWSRVCRRAIELIAGREPMAPALRPILAEFTTQIIDQAPYNIALHKPAIQSSISDWSVGNTLESDAAGAVSGGITGRARFHTSLEESPWWRVDLQVEHPITEIRIYNRTDIPELAKRASWLAVEIGNTESTLTEVFRRETDDPFGSLNGEPLIVKLSSATTGRFVKIRLLKPNFLHLDQVQVFGARKNGESTEPEISSTTEPDVALRNASSDHEILDRFQSIGNNCEFGSVQKSIGIAKLSLLQWTASTPTMIILAFENNWEIYGRADTIQAVDHHGEYFSKDLVYGFESHSFISTEQMKPNDFVTMIASKTKFLVRKFLEDVEDGGNIFVYNFFEEKLPSFNILVELASALSQKVRNYLIAIGLPGQYCLSENTVFHHQPGLILATKDSFTTFNSTPALYRPGWVKICRQALSLIKQHDHDFWNAHQRRISERIAETGAAQPNVGNLCIGKSATQSSISPYSIGRTPEEDAKGAIDGNANGQVKFHTDFEDNPWWQVDLGDVFGVSEVKIYNRIDVPGVMARAARIAIEIGLTPDELVEMYRRENDDPFGGVDGNGWLALRMPGPLSFKPTIPIPGRFVRIRLLTRNYLHLDQVEVYGEPLPNFTQPATTLASAEQP